MTALPHYWLKMQSFKLPAEAEEKCITITAALHEVS